MAKSRDNVITNAKKKMGRPVTTGKGELVGVRLLPNLLGAVDKYQELVEAESRPEAIRHAVTETLKRRGIL